VSSAEELHDKQLKQYLRNVLGFRPGNMELYRMACIHRSSSHKDVIGGRINNERLEYLGDAVLSTVVAEFLYNKYPTAPEGMLTELRSKLVNRERLNGLSQKIGLSQLVVMNSHVHAKSANGDAFEALVGAIFLDKGYNKTKKILLKKIFLVHLDIESISLEENNFKSKLLSWGQKYHRQIEFRHKVINEHSAKRLYEITIFIDDQEQGTVQSFAIKKGEQEAAEKVWNNMLKDF
jgi:ribonuclease-3